MIWKIISPTCKLSASEIGTRHEDYRIGEDPSLHSVDKATRGRLKLARTMHVARFSQVGVSPRHTRFELLSPTPRARFLADFSIFSFLSFSIHLLFLFNSSSLFLFTFPPSHLSAFRYSRTIFQRFHSFHSNDQKDLSMHFLFFEFSANSFTPHPFYSMNALIFIPL